jgi:hypothetical protein
MLVVTNCKGSDNSVQRVICEVLLAKQLPLRVPGRVLSPSSETPDTCQAKAELDTELDNCADTQRLMPDTPRTRAELATELDNQAGSHTFLLLPKFTRACSLTGVSVDTGTLSKRALQGASDEQLRATEQYL